MIVFSDVHSFIYSLNMGSISKGYAFMLNSKIIRLVQKLFRVDKSLITDERRVDLYVSRKIPSKAFFRKPS